MSEPTNQPPTEEPVTITEVKTVGVPGTVVKRSTNWGIYMLIIAIFIVIGAVIYVTRKDAKKMGANGNMVYNSMTISNNSGYAYRANNRY